MSLNQDFFGWGGWGWGVNRIISFLLYLVLIFTIFSFSFVFVGLTLICLDGKRQVPSHPFLDHDKEKTKILGALGEPSPN